MTRVLILGGGPDAERDVSIDSAKAIHKCCLEAGFDATLLIVDRPSLAEIQSWDTDVVFPALHGRFGEGGGLQVLLEKAGCPFIGSKSQAARLAMDKMGTKLIASRFSIPTPAAVVFDPSDAQYPDESICPLEMPVVIKPIADGSSIGLYICHDEQDWCNAIEKINEDFKSNPHRVYMIERMVQGRELTVSLISDENGEIIPLPLIEIAPAEGVYDFEAKYARNDTVYTVGPDIPESVVQGIQDHALLICIALGVRHLARVDFLYADDGHWVMLEANTMPGFTKTSLMPMAAHAHGMGMTELCAHLVNTAIRENADLHPNF
jgi:D-alanine-D-alanine ligase